MAASISAKIFSSLERLIKTEAQTAYNESMGASISQVSADNEDDRVRVMKRWDASFDENMCEDCGDMDGETVAADEPFDFKGEELMNPPAHPHCGCGTTVLVELPEEGK
jgi:hypothetical protein